MLQVSHVLDYAKCKDNPWAFGPLCSIISNVVILDRPIHHRGGQGPTPIEPSVLADVRRQLAHSKMRINDVSALLA